MRARSLTAATLPDSAPVGAEGPLKGAVPRGRAGGVRERPAIALVAQRRARVVEAAAPEKRRRRRPRFAVAVGAGGAHLRAQRDQLCQVGHSGHVLELGDPDEAMRVQVIAEEERRVAVAGREEPRPPVVEEVCLVDRLEPECEPLLGERREDGLGLPLGGRAQRRAPERALALGFERDHAPEISGGSRQRPRRCGRRPRPCARATRTWPRTGTARRRSRAPADGGRGRRSGRYRWRARRRSHARALRDRRASASRRLAALARTGPVPPRAERRAARARRRRRRRAGGAAPRDRPRSRADSPRACPPGTRLLWARAGP